MRVDDRASVAFAAATLTVQKAVGLRIAGVEVLAAAANVVLVAFQVHPGIIIAL
jgi:hypothetical protein